MQAEIGTPFGLRKGPSGALGLLLEGRRHNLIQYSNDIEALVPALAGTRSGAIKSIFSGEEVAAFTVHTNQTRRITFSVKNTLKSKDFTISFYGVIATSERRSGENAVSVPYEISISDGKEKKTNSGSLSKHWKRHSCSFSFSRTPKQIFCEFATLPNCIMSHPIEYQFGITGLCLEEGLFRTSPITTAGEIGRREPDKLSIKGDNLSLSKDGTFLFVYQPIWKPAQLGAGNDPIIFEALCSSDGEQGCRLVHSSQSDGELRLDVLDQGGGVVRSFVGKRPPPTNEVLIASLNWSGSDISLYLDGDLVTEGTLDYPISATEELYIGSSRTDSQASLFCHMKQFKVFDEIISERSLRALLFAMDPGIFGRFKSIYEKILKSSDCPLVEGEYREIIDLLIRVAAGWSEFGRKFDDEAGYRNSCAEHLYSNNLVQSRESLSHDGETDITIHISDGSDSLPAKQIKVEFKIWPRNDYKEAPAKPIKYMSEFDEVGVVYMISELKKKDISEQFKEIVTSNSDYICLQCWDQPLGAALPYHFVTKHRDPVTETDKIILSILFSSLANAGG